MQPRVAPLVVGLILLGLASVPAQALQLCGVTQFADTVVLSFTQEDGPRLILASQWVQTAPSYDLAGPGTIIQKFLPERVFLGSGMLGNTSPSFGGNPICRITPHLEVETADPLIVTGTAVILCVSGPSGPFQVTLDLIFAPCEEPAFPGATTGYRERQLLKRPGQEMPLDQRRASGDEDQNELAP